MVILMTAKQKVKANKWFEHDMYYGVKLLSTRIDFLMIPSRNILGIVSGQAAGQPLTLTLTNSKSRITIASPQGLLSHREDDQETLIA